MEEEIRQIGENPFFNDNDNYFILKKNYNFVYKDENEEDEGDSEGEEKEKNSNENDEIKIDPNEVLEILKEFYNEKKKKAQEKSKKYNILYLIFL